MFQAEINKEVDCACHKVETTQNRTLVGNMSVGSANSLNITNTGQLAPVSVDCGMHGSRGVGAGWNL